RPPSQRTTPSLPRAEVSCGIEFDCFSSQRRLLRVRTKRRSRTSQQHHMQHCHAESNGVVAKHGSIVGSHLTSAWCTRIAESGFALYWWLQTRSYANARKWRILPVPGRCCLPVIKLAPTGNGYLPRS